MGGSNRNDSRSSFLDNGTVRFFCFCCSCELSLSLRSLSAESEESSDDDEESDLGLRFAALLLLLLPFFLLATTILAVIDDLIGTVRSYTRMAEWDFLYGRMECNSDNESRVL